LGCGVKNILEIYMAVRCGGVGLVAGLGVKEAKKCEISLTLAFHGACFTNSAVFVLAWNLLILSLICDYVGGGAVAKKRVTESEHAEAVRERLHECGWATYAEVSMYSGDMRADIVAVKNGVVIVVETKTSYTLDLLEQAERWKFQVHAVYVSAPTDGSKMFHRLRQHLGIGLMKTWKYCDTYLSEGRLNRNPHGLKRILPMLCEERRVQPAGVAMGGYYTPFRGTVDNLRRLLARKKDQTATWKELLMDLDHHYSSDSVAKSTLSKWIRLGKCEGIEIVDMRPLRVRLVMERASE
jgi:hypothetical protein